MGVIDWRAWTNQNGGTLPTGLPNPPYTPNAGNTPFPGVGPIGIGATPGPPGKSDIIDGAQSFPTYANVPTYIKPVDPFGGWANQKELVANSAGAQVPTMRPAIPGLTSP